MTVFTKDPASPEVIEALKKEGKTLLQVTCTRLYMLEGEPERGLETLMHEWFVRYRGRFHAYRDGSHMVGGDVVTEVKVLTDGGRVLALGEAAEPKKEWPQGMTEGHAHYIHP